jgi:hypothetical protein
MGFVCARIGGAGRYELDLIAELNRIGVPMMSEDLTRIGALLESLQTSVSVVAEGHVALVERLDRMENRFESRFDGLELQVKGLELQVKGLEVQTKGLEVFASDAQRRLERIETHLQLNGSSASRPRGKATRPAPPKRRKKG